MDIGTSGGVHGLDRGYCLMIGGDKAAFDRLEPIFATLVPGKGEIEPTSRRPQPDERAGLSPTGPTGSGHFVKMIHNGIEYGMMQAFAEGFDLLRNASAKERPAGRIRLRFRHRRDRRGLAPRLGGHVLAARSHGRGAGRRRGAVLLYRQCLDPGEGRWTVDAAVETATPAEVPTSALFARFRSRVDHTFGEKVLSAMRAGFGGHVEAKKQG